MQPALILRQVKLIDLTSRYSVQTLQVQRFFSNFVGSSIILNWEILGHK